MTIVEVGFESAGKVINGGALKTGGQKDSTLNHIKAKITLAC